MTKKASGIVNLEKAFLYDGWNRYAEFDKTNGTILAQTYIWGLDLSGSMQGAGGVGGLLGVKPAGSSVHFTAYDANGNVMGLVDGSSGAISASYEYGPFAEPIRATGPMAFNNPFRFSSKASDDESGFLYYGYRFYNPSTGRWPNRDPIGERGGINLYGFVHNNSLNAYDPLGRDVVCRLDPSAVGGNGHAAILIGNDTDGWTFFSFGFGKCMMNPFGGNTADNLDTRRFKSFDDARKDSAMARYGKFIRWNTDKAADRKAIDAIRPYFDKGYNLFKCNCDDVAMKGIKAAGVDAVDKWRPVDSYKENKGKGDESGDFPKKPDQQIP